MPSLRDQLCAALILAHVVGMSAAALPMFTKTLPDNPQKTFRNAILTWGSPALSLGLADSEEALIARFVSANNTIVDARSTLLGPVLALQRLTGTRQSWQMFAQVNPKGGRLQLHVRTGEGDWKPIFIDHVQPEWRAGLLNHHRVRSFRNTYARGARGRHGSFVRMARWLAPGVAEDFPEATEFRARYQHLQPGGPEEIRAVGGRTPGAVFFEEVIDLEALR